MPDRGSRERGTSRARELRHSARGPQGSRSHASGVADPAAAVRPSAAATGLARIAAAAQFSGRAHLVRDFRRRPGHCGALEGAARGPPTRSRPRSAASCSRRPRPSAPRRATRAWCPTSGRARGGCESSPQAAQTPSSRATRATAMTPGARSALRFLFCSIAGSVCLLAAGQSAPPGGQAVFKSGVDLVHLDVSVLDRARVPVRGLTAADFTILEDGVARPISAFAELLTKDSREGVRANFGRRQGVTRHSEQRNRTNARRAPVRRRPRRRDDPAGPADGRDREEDRGNGDRPPESRRPDGRGVHREQQGRAEFHGRPREAPQGRLDIQAGLRDTSVGLGQRGLERGEEDLRACRRSGRWPPGRLASDAGDGRRFAHRRAAAAEGNHLGQHRDVRRSSRRLSNHCRSAPASA